jgi:hypothetical protein
MLNNILKWVATVILIIGTGVNSLGYYPAGPVLLLLGGLLWFVVSVRWREPALIVTNGVMNLVAVTGLAINFL